MSIRKIRSRGLYLQRGAIPHAGFIRKHEWRWQFGCRLFTGEIGHFNGFRFIQS